MGMPELGATVGSIAGYAAGVPISIWCIKLILNKKFKGYSICLIKDEEPTYEK